MIPFEEPVIFLIFVSTRALTFDNIVSCVICGLFKELTHHNFYFQKALPKLPVPELSSTLHKYLRAVKATISAKQYERTAQVVAKFGEAGGEGESLQRILQEFSDNTENWVRS